MAILVPDTTTFSLQDVWNAVKDHTPSTTDDLQDCFDNAIMDYFDLDYTGYESNSLLRFRNYGPKVEVIPCDQEQAYEGGQTYPTEYIITLGTGTGTVILDFYPQSVPDLITIDWGDGSTTYTGYRGESEKFDYGGSDRADFRNSLNGLWDPSNSYTYPNYTYHPEDGYPRVETPIQFSYNKPYTEPTQVKVNVWAPMPSTVWSFILHCPS